MANIPYKNIHGRKNSSKGKMPWIRYNGFSVADSQLCMEFLNKKFDVDLNSQLTETERALARAFSKLIEESLAWYMILEWWVYSTDEPWLGDAGIPKFIRGIVRRGVKTAGYHQGMGRHTRGELHGIMSEDIQAISAYLGRKQFLMGFKPSEVDCTAFGVIAQFILNMPGSVADKLIREKHPNLVAYCQRMKTQYWSDWEDCITDGGKRKATK